MTSLALETYQIDATREYWAFGYEWGRIAKWLVKKGMFSLDGSMPTSDTDPLYIFIIAPFFQAFGVFSTSAAMALILLQSLLCGLTTWALYALAEKLYGPFEARLSALLFAVYPASIFFAVVRIGPSSLSVLLLCLTFLFVLRLRSSRRWLPAVLSGLLIGLVVLCSSDNLSLLLVVPLWLILTSTGQRWGMLVRSLLIIATAMLVLLPWSMRNASVLGEPTITKGNLGYHLWVGNNPKATGHYATSVPTDITTEGVSESQSEYYRMAISWIAHNPKAFLILTLKRMQYFWYVIPNRQESSMELFQAWMLLTMLGLAVVGIFWREPRFEGLNLLLLFVAIYPLVFYVTHASFYRHRYHVEPFLLILASHGLHSLWAMYASKQGNVSPAIRLPREAVRLYMLRRKGSASRGLQLLILNAFCRLGRDMRGLRTDQFVGFFFGGNLHKKNLQTLLQRLPPTGTCELMCHPGLADPGTCYSHWGYHWSEELSALVDPEVSAFLRQKGIQLTSYRQMAEL